MIAPPPVRISPLVVIGILLTAARADAQQPAAQREAASPAARVVSVELNGKPLVEAIAFGGGAPDEVFVPVAELARVLDGGPSTIGAAVTPAHLRVDGAQLLAVAVGGCASCPLRVTRRVVISTRARTIGGSVAIPLADVVAALEGRVEADRTRTHFVIHAGRCTWCILEPR